MKEQEIFFAENMRARGLNAMSEKSRKTPVSSNVIQFISPEKKINNNDTLIDSALTRFDRDVSKVNRIYDQERVISELIRLSFSPLNDFLYQAAKLITSVKWLNLQPSCAIFLTRHEGSGRVMRMACDYNLEQDVSNKCAHVIFGECLCGQVAVSQQNRYTTDVNKVDNFLCPTDKRQGAYSIPILLEDRVLGVMALYLQLEHKQQGYELDFLNNVAKILAVGISRRLAEEESLRLASHNGLTSLPNRLLLTERMQTQLSVSGECALIYIDIDRFGKVNDFLGYSAGDSVLIEIAQRFRGAVRNEGMLAHLGGDEFAILVNKSKNQENSIFETTQSIIKKLKYFLDDELILKTQKLNLTFSAGIVIIDGQEKSPEALLSQARMALLQAKIEGQNPIQYFVPEMQQIAQSKLTIENNLSSAVENGEMELYFQPQFNADKNAYAAEALLRWNGENGQILPGKFLLVAEESGLIVQLGRWVLEESCRKIVQWNDKLNLQHIAVNVSAVQFNLSTFIETVDEILEKTGADPTKLMLELTESILVDNPQDIIEKMHRLKERGIKISIDDFGTGYSSLSYLKHFPIDQLKIDKSFIQNINTDESDQVIVGAILAIARQMRFELIAEGVETVEQFNYLVSEGCTNFQGFYFNVPLPAYEFCEQYIQ